MKKIILGIVGILAILIIIFVLQSAPIDPAAYTPPKSQKLAGVLEPNNLLQKAELLALGKINGPEEVAVDSQGRIYGGTQDGKIMRLLPDGKLDNINVRRSSRHKALDDAAIRIVRLAAPYAPFPKNFRDEVDIIHITRTWKFQHGDRLSSQ